MVQKDNFGYKLFLWGDEFGHNNFKKLIYGYFKYFSNEFSRNNRNRYQSERLTFF